MNNKYLAIKALLSGTLLLFITTAQAAPLGLTQAYPDLLVSALDLNYDSGTNTFTAQNTIGSSFLFSPDGSPAVPYAADSYSLMASIDNSGNLTGGGSLTIMDGVTSVLSANVTAFGFDGFGIPGVSTFYTLEFLLDVTSSISALGFGNSMGIIIGSGDLNPIVGPDERFLVNFSGTGNSDNFSVPEPSTVSLFILAGLGMLMLRAQRKINQ